MDDRNSDALQRAHDRIEMLERAVRYSDALLAISRLADEANEPLETARKAVGTIASVADVDYGGLSQLDGDVVRMRTVWRNATVPDAYVERAEAGIPRSTSVAYFAIQRNEPVFIDDYARHVPHVPELAALGCRGLAVIPLGGGFSGGALTMTAARFGRPRTWSEADRELFLAAGRVIRLSVERRDQLRWYETLALTDPLTGIGNRRAFEIDLEAALAAARRHGFPVSLLTMDMDGLKILNDTRGHAVGDALLVAFTVHLRELFRSEDRLYRIGGDEFAVILSHSSARDRDAVLARVDNAAIRVRASGFAQAGVSAGVATFPDEAATAEQLRVLSDKRMYVDKRTPTARPRVR